MLRARRWQVTAYAVSLVALLLFGADSSSPLAWLGAIAFIVAAGERPPRPVGSGNETGAAPGRADLARIHPGPGPTGCWPATSSASTRSCCGASTCCSSSARDPPRLPRRRHPHPNGGWVVHQARNLALAGLLERFSFLIGDRDGKHTSAFDTVFATKRSA